MNLNNKTILKKITLIQLIAVAAIGFFAAAANAQIPTPKATPTPATKTIDQALDGMFKDKVDYYDLVKKPDDARKLLIQYSNAYNAENKIFAEKDEIARKDQDKSGGGLFVSCKPLVDVYSELPAMEKAADDIVRLYKSGDAAKVATAGEMKQLKYIVEDWRPNVFLKRRDEIRSLISIHSECSEESKITFDDLMNAAGKDIEARRQREIVEQIQLLGKMSGYFAAGQKFNALTTGSSTVEVCRVTMDYKLESDAIEPILDKIIEINNDGYPVKFENADAAKVLETTLKFHTQLFLPKKANIASVAAKYGCK